jgi:hypothetical protein
MRLDAIGAVATVLGTALAAVPYIEPVYRQLSKVVGEGVVGEWTCVGNCESGYPARICLGNCDPSDPNRIRLPGPDALELRDEHLPPNVTVGYYRPNTVPPTITNAALIGYIVNDGNAINWRSAAGWNGTAWVRSPFPKWKTLGLGLIAGAVFSFAVLRFRRQ